MVSLKNTYNNILGEALLDEARVEFNQLDNDIVLFEYIDYLILISTKGLIVPKGEIIQYSHLLPYVLGAIDYRENIYNTNEISTIAAEKGYGLIMYELAMQSSYPKGIVSSRNGDTKDGAFRLYQYYYEGLNPNVKVEKIEPNDEKYVSCVDRNYSKIQCEDDGITPLRPELMKLYNSILYMKPNEYNILKNRSIFLLKQYGEYLEDAVITAGDIFFKSKYKK